MNRLLTVLSVGFVLVAAEAPAAPVAPPPREVALYFPTTVGTKWTYQYPDKQVLTLMVTAVQQEGTAWVVSVGELEATGRVSLHQTFEVSAKGVYRLESVVRTFSADGRGGTARTEKMELDVPPLCLLKLPATPGEKWEAVLGRLGKVSYTTGREEVVKVPAGVFTAVRVNYEQAGAVGGQAVRERFWYAPGVGAVKWAADDGAESVMTAFSPGKK